MVFLLKTDLVPKITDRLRNTGTFFDSIKCRFRSAFTYGTLELLSMAGFMVAVIMVFKDKPSTRHDSGTASEKFRYFSSGSIPPTVCLMLSGRRTRRRPGGRDVKKAVAGKNRKRWFDMKPFEIHHTTRPFHCMVERRTLPDNRFS